MQRSFGESDDQYGKYDLRLSGLAAASDANQGFERDAWSACLVVKGKVDAKIFVWILDVERTRSRASLVGYAASERKRMDEFEWVWKWKWEWVWMWMWMWYWMQ